MAPNDLGTRETFEPIELLTDETKQKTIINSNETNSVYLVYSVYFNSVIYHFIVWSLIGEEGYHKIMFSLHIVYLDIVVNLICWMYF